jgi:uncharacterized protein (DUF849 family)
VAISRALDAAGSRASRLWHGYGMAHWSVVEAGIRSGGEVRAGLEDSLRPPDGRVASGNAEFVAAAFDIARAARSRER